MYKIIKVYLADEYRRIIANTRGDIAVHKTKFVTENNKLKGYKSSWTISHIPTGLALRMYSDKKIANIVAEKIVASQIDLNFIPGDLLKYRKAKSDWNNFMRDIDALYIDYLTDHFCTNPSFCHFSEKVNKPCPTNI